MLKVEQAEKLTSNLEKILDSSYSIQLENRRHIHITDQHHNIFDFLIIDQKDLKELNNVRSEVLKDRVKTNSEQNIYTGIIQINPKRKTVTSSPQYSMTNDKDTTILRQAPASKTYEVNKADEIVFLKGFEELLNYTNGKLNTTKFKKLFEKEYDEDCARGDFVTHESTTNIKDGKIIFVKEEYDHLITIAPEEYKVNNKHHLDMIFESVPIVIDDKTFYDVRKRTQTVKGYTIQKYEGSDKLDLESAYKLAIKPYINKQSELQSQGQLRMFAGSKVIIIPEDYKSFETNLNTSSDKLTKREMFPGTDQEYLALVQISIEPEMIKYLNRLENTL